MASSAPLPRESMADHPFSESPPPMVDSLDGPSSSRSVKIFTRHQIKEMILQGDVLVLHRAVVYRLNYWLEKHPGGQLAILHFVGRDATDELEAYHPPAIIARMRGFIIGRVSDDEWDGGEAGKGWPPIMPPVEVGLWPMPRLPVDEGDDSGYSSGDSGSAGQSKAPRATSSPTLRRRGVPSQSPSPPSTPRPAGPDRSSLSFDQMMQLLEPPAPSKEALESHFDVDPARQHHLSLSYQRLHETIKAKGYYTAPQPFYGYGPDLIRYTLLFVAFFTLSPFWPYAKALCGLQSKAEAAANVAGMSTLRHFSSAVFLGLWWHQITFVAHDAGHSGITGKWWVDRCLGILIADFIGGLSIGWWCDNHDVHHLVTNHPEHDPDIQHIPFFAISTRFFASMWSTYYKRVMAFDGPSRFFVSMQHRLYYIVMLFGRFNLFVNSYAFLLTKARPSSLRNLEFAGVAFFWVYFSTLLWLLPAVGIRVMFVLVSFAVTSPLHVQIVLSHFAQSTVDLGPGESFAHRQVRTTMDVSCPPYLDFLHGGLHMQVTHHLFPRIPRHRLRAASLDVMRWCEEEGLEYRTFTFTEGNKRVLRVLEDVARQIQVLSVVACAQAKGELHG